MEIEAFSYPEWEPDLIQRMQELQIDIELTYQRMKKINAGEYDKIEAILAKEIPEVDGEQIVELVPERSVVFQYEEVQERVKEFGLDIDLKCYGKFRDSGEIIFSYQNLQELGKAFAPLVAYGFLNGGSASSYVDKKKNQKIYGSLFDIYQPYLEKIKNRFYNKPKAITPAYLNPDGSLGEDYMLLKIRAILIKAFQYIQKYGTSHANGLYRMFQMTSISNESEIMEALQRYTQSPLLKEWIARTKIDITQMYTRAQPLLATFTSKRPVEVFQNAYGIQGKLLPMPGGHGHNFYVLKDVYQTLLSEGKRFAYLSNIDNMGSTIEDASLAYFALSGKQAAFEFSIKTEADVKGGIAVIDQYNRLNCGDIGVAIPKEEVEKAEKKGKKILFNTATGIFDLKYLVPRLTYISENLPMRLSIQEKDAGTYLQCEQVTWEILGMLEKPLIFVVDKYKRFLAAKLLIEGLMGSGLELEHPLFPKQWQKIARNLTKGMKHKLETEYGMELVNNRWIPKSVEKFL